MPESTIRWKVTTRLRDMPDLSNHGGVAEGQVVAFQGVAVVTKIRARPASRAGVQVLEAHLDPIELVVGEAVPVIRPSEVEAPVEALAVVARAR